MEFLIRITFITSQDYQTHWSHTKEGNLSRPVVRATTRTFTPATLANPSHNSRVPRFIHHLEPQLKRCHSESQLKNCHVLNPYPKPQLKGYVPSHNSRNPASRPTRYHQSIVDHAHQKQTKLMPFHHRVALLRSRYAKIASRSLSGGHVPLGAKHL